MPQLLLSVMTAQLMMAQITLAGMASVPVVSPHTPYDAPGTAQDFKDYAASLSDIYGLGKAFTATLACESGWSSSIRGDGGESVGVAQINLPAHKDVSEEQAEDPYWAIEWSAHEFAIGRASQWTCYRQYVKLNP